MGKLYVALLCGAAFLVAADATADDSSATLAAGGIQFAQSADIRMADEDLRISPKQVHIRFVFTNDSDKAIDTLVAFPLPDLDTAEFTHSGLGTVTKDPVNFVGFTVSADGKTITPFVEQRAFLKGRDVTDMVKAAGAPVNAVTEYDALQKISQAARKKLGAAGLLELDEPDAVFPAWTVRTRFYWRQHFPAHGSVVLEQSYQPVTGEAFFGKTELAGQDQDARYYLKNYCIDEPSRATIGAMIADRLRAEPNGGGYLIAYTTDYILETGNNWKGPIGRFHLTLDKVKPSNVLSLCWDGNLKKTGATTFEDTRENFAPKSDIKLLVLDEVPPS